MRDRRNFGERTTLAFEGVPEAHQKAPRGTENGKLVGDDFAGKREKGVFGPDPSFVNRRRQKHYGGQGSTMEDRGLMVGSARKGGLKPLIGNNWR